MAANSGPNIHKPLSATNWVDFNQFLKDSVLLCLPAIFLDFEAECYFKLCSIISSFDIFNIHEAFILALIPQHLWLWWALWGSVYCVCLWRMKGPAAPGSKLTLTMPLGAKCLLKCCLLLHAFLFGFHTHVWFPQQTHASFYSDSHLWHYGGFFPPLFHSKAISFTSVFF